MIHEQRIDDLIEVLIEVTQGNYNIRPVLSDKNDGIDALAMAVDLMIDNVSYSEQKKKEYLASLEKSNKELDQFAYVVSHDLKAPLRAINNLSLWIEEDLGTTISADVKNNIQMLRGRVGRMESLIGGILEYSKAGRQADAIEKLDSNKLVLETIEFLSPPESFTVAVQNDMPAVYADKIKIQQVFSNLIGNAVKYHHTQNGLIKIACKNEGDYYHFSVTDDGPGIDPKYHQKVFEIFQTLQARDVIESTGIGLAIVKKIVADAGGAIWIDSELGHGTSFIFSWPKKSKEISPGNNLNSAN